MTWGGKERIHGTDYICKDLTEDSEKDMKIPSHRHGNKFEKFMLDKEDIGI